MIAHYGPTLHSGHYVSFINSGNRWFLFDDDKYVLFSKMATLPPFSRRSFPNRVHLVDLSIVLKQNAYMLYYRRALTPATTSAANSSPTTDKLRSSAGGSKKLNQSAEVPKDATPLSASTEKQQESLMYLTPIYNLFYETDGAEISKLHLTAETPLEDDIFANLALDSHVLAGTTNLILKTRQYRLEVRNPKRRFCVTHFLTCFALQLDIPFSVNLSKSRSIIYQAHRTIVVEFPVLSADSEASQAEQAATKIPFEACSPSDKSPNHDFTFDAEQKLDLEAKLDDEAHRLKSKDDEKFVEGLQKIESINQETSSYGQLYKDIEAFYATVQKRPASFASSTAPPTKDKVKPNDPCPCRSGAKYKKCHGKNV
jgi:hypothetical protein